MVVEVIVVVGGGGGGGGPTEGVALFLFLGQARL